MNYYRNFQEDLLFFFVLVVVGRLSVSAMPADTMEKQTASPIAGAPANGSHTPDKPKNASEHRKVRMMQLFNLYELFQCTARVCVFVCGRRVLMLNFPLLCSLPNPSWKNAAERELTKVSGSSRLSSWTL